MSLEGRAKRTQDAVDQARQRRLEKAVDDLRSADDRGERTPVAGERGDPVRRRPGSWEERRQARRDVAKGLVDPALAVAPEVVKIICPEAEQPIQAATQAFDRVTGHNTDGALSVVSHAVDRLKAGDENRRYPAQARRALDEGQ